MKAVFIGKKALGLYASFALLLRPGACPAATLTVTTTNDSGAGSLRQCIQIGVSGDSINFGVGGTIMLTTGELLITNNLTITGPGATNLAVSGNNASRVFNINAGVMANVAGLTIRDGKANAGLYPGGRGDAGGGVYNAGTLTLNDCVITNNTGGVGATGLPGNPHGGVGGWGGWGGGIYNAGTMTLNASTVSGNFGGHGGQGGIAQFDASGGLGGYGGGIYNQGTLTAHATTFSGNAGGDGGDVGGYYARGGAGGAGGGIFNAATCTLTLCTVCGNFGGKGSSSGFYFGNGGDGGGVASGANPDNDPITSLIACTIRSNSAGYGGFCCSTPGRGGGFFNDGSQSPPTLRNTLVAQNTNPGNSSPDLYGFFTSQGHNLIGQADGGGGITNGINNDLAGSTNAPLNPLLGPLQSNGGPTPTMALLAGSPALNTGDDTLLAVPFNLPTDQRGLPRKSGAHIDIGAFERQALLITGLARSGTDIRIDFIAEVGVNYRLERRDTPASGEWATVADNLPGSGSITQMIDPGAANQPQRFYRARTVP